MPPTDAWLKMPYALNIFLTQMCVVIHKNMKLTCHYCQASSKRDPNAEYKKSIFNSKESWQWWSNKFFLMYCICTAVSHNAMPKENGNAKLWMVLWQLQQDLSQQNIHWTRQWHEGWTLALRMPWNRPKKGGVFYMRTRLFGLSTAPGGSVSPELTACMLRLGKTNFSHRNIWTQI